MAEKKEKYDISGMTCAACSAYIDKSVRKLEGVNDVNVNLLQNSMTVNYDESAVDRKQIISAVESGGYKAILSGEKEESASKDIVAEDYRNRIQRLKYSVGMMLVLSYISMGRMLGLPLPEFLGSPQAFLTNGIIQLLLSLMVLAVNREYFTSGFKALFNKAANMDSLIAIGSGTSFVYSLYSLLMMAGLSGYSRLNDAMTYSHNLYFESAAMIVVFVSVGKLMESRSKEETRNSLKNLIRLKPADALVVRNNAETRVSLKDLVVNDIVVLKAGDSVPTDGIIINGSLSIDESAITGESLPKTKELNDHIYSGTIVSYGYATYMVSKPEAESTLAKMISLIEDASGSKAPVARLADKIAAVFVPFVIVIAVLTAIGWFIASKELSTSLTMGIAVLVVSCPCALGLATPTSIMVSTGKAAELNILVKEAKTLEYLQNIDTVVLDKTGTVTEGKPYVIEVDIDEDGKSVMELVYGLESKSEHPLSVAICNYAEEKGISKKTIDDFEAVTGQGVIGSTEGIKIIAGNRRMMESNNIDISGLSEKSDAITSKGGTAIFIAVADKAVGIIAIADRIRKDSKIAIEELQKMNLEVIMLTGDSKNTAEVIRKEAGIKKAISEVLPQDKENQIVSLQKEGRKVMMVGDGINDALALTSSDIGVAIGNGSDITLDSADVILLKDSLLNLVDVIRLSKATLRNIKQNLFWAFGYNIVGIPLAMGLLYPFTGWRLSPMFGSAMMALSSTIVVTNALRLRGFKPFEIKEKKTMKKEIKISGMSCMHCQARVEKALNDLDGVRAEVSLANNNAICEVNEGISNDTLKKAVEDAGYEVTEIINK